MLRSPARRRSEVLIRARRNLSQRGCTFEHQRSPRTEMTIDVNKARLAAHRNNLMRYRRILATPLTDIERAYVRRRIDEERALLEQLEQQHRSVAASAS